MIDVRTWLAMNVWRLMTVGVAAGAVFLGVRWMAERVISSDLRDQVSKLDRSINDPETGYVHQIEQCRTNGAQVKSSLEKQNRDLKAQAIEDAASLAASEKRLEVAQAESRKRRLRINEILSYQAAGDTVCTRMLNKIEWYKGGLK